MQKSPPEAPSSNTRGAVTDEKSDPIKTPNYLVCKLSNLAYQQYTKALFLMFHGAFPKEYQGIIVQRHFQQCD